VWKLLLRLKTQATHEASPQTLRTIFATLGDFLDFRHSERADWELLFTWLVGKSVLTFVSMAFERFVFG
jgi:hypothetical protein